MLVTDFFNPVWDILGNVFSTILSYWWAIAPLILFLVVFDLFKDYTKSIYLSNLKWIMLEIRLPQETKRSPLAMEQVFAALHTAPGGVRKKWVEGFWKGKVGDWFSLEIVGIGGDIHFYVRALESHRNIVESSIYAQFPEAEIQLADDYMSAYPDILPDDGTDIAVGEFVLEKTDAYPIRTYVDFEEKNPGKDEYQRIDSLASLVEGMSLLGPRECLALQIMIQSKKGDDWVKESQKEIDKIMGKKEESKKDIFNIFFDFIDSLISAGAKDEKKSDEFSTVKLTPGRLEALKAIERNITKLGFKSTLRMLYISPMETFNKSRPAIVAGTLKQFSSLNLNGFKKDSPDFDWVFKKSREYKYKVEIYKKFRKREFLKKPYVLNSEELASIFHIPDVGVKTSTLPRIDAKKGEAPVGLPT